MSGPFLIAHKVRGSTAFDIAEMMLIGTERGWIIPTSGNRAYPFWVQPLKVPEIPPMPEGIPDHYPAPVRAKQPDIIDLEELGLL